MKAPQDLQRLTPALKEAIEAALRAEEMEIALGFCDLIDDLAERQALIDLITGDPRNVAVVYPEAAK